MNVLNILQNKLVRNNGIKNILNSKLSTGIYASYTLATQPCEKTERVAGSLSMLLGGPRTRKV
jgi:hypothetical protein